MNTAMIIEGSGSRELMAVCATAADISTVKQARITIHCMGRAILIYPFQSSIYRHGQ